MTAAATIPPMHYQPTMNQASLVVLGRLNPAIIQPRWLEQIGALGAREREAAEASREVDTNLIITQNLSQFKTPDLTLVCDPTKLSITVAEEPFVKVRDFVNVVLNSLVHTPIFAMGINRVVQFRMAHEEGWHRFGDQLAPKQCWEFLFKTAGLPPKEREGGLRNIVMRKPRKTEGLYSYTDVNTGPILEKKGEYGRIFISINDHYEFLNKAELDGSRNILTLLEKTWDETYKMNETTIATLMELAKSLDREK